MEVPKNIHRRRRFRDSVFDRSGVLADMTFEKMRGKKNEKEKEEKLGEKGI